MTLAYNIEFVEYKAGDYTELETGLKELSDEVENYRRTNPI
jgi:hypothetical protein